MSAEGLERVRALFLGMTFRTKGVRVFFQEKPGTLVDIETVGFAKHVQQAFVAEHGEEVSKADIDAAVAEIRDAAHAAEGALAAPASKPEGLVLDAPSLSKTSAAEALGASKPSPVQWMSTADVFAPLPPTTHIVEGLDFAHGRPTALSSFGSGGKTLAAQSMGLSLASGRPVWGHFRVTKPLRVGHIDVDQGDWATKRRYQRLRLGMGLSEEDFADRLLVCTMPKLQLHGDGAVEILVRIIEEARLDFLWLDAYRRLMSGFDENDSRYSQGFESCTRASEKTKVPIAILIHSGKKDDGGAGTAMRGSSALYDSAGAVYKFTGAADDVKTVRHERPSALHEGIVGDSFKLEIVGEAGAPLAVRYVGAKAVEGTGAPNKAERLRGKVLAFVVANGGAGVRAVREGVGGRAALVDAALAGLVDAGAIEKQDGKYSPRVSR